MVAGLLALIMEAFYRGRSRAEWMFGTSNCNALLIRLVLLTRPSARWQSLSNHTTGNADYSVRAGSGQAAPMPAAVFSSLSLVLPLQNSKARLMGNSRLSYDSHEASVHSVNLASSLVALLESTS